VTPKNEWVIKIDMYLGLNPAGLSDATKERIEWTYEMKFTESGAIEHMKAYLKVQ
jgi:hypothetical protein